MKFEEIKGDLFGCEENVSFAHCISEDCRMGKGIAVLFKQKFGGVSDLQKQVSSGAKTGHVAVLERNNRFVYYLITKKKYSDKPTYDTLKRSLIDMKEHMVENKVTKLAMPRIGCGLDGLQWNLVSPIMKDVFIDTDIDITVYYL